MDPRTKCALKITALKFKITKIYKIMLIILVQNLIKCLGYNSSIEWLDLEKNFKCIELGAKLLFIIIYLQ